MEPEEKSNGALVGSFIIIIILILGGIYVWQKSLQEKPTPLPLDSSLSKESVPPNIERY
ncbi:hypothetical protein HZA26_02970 [Candidatus Nomurabacteria bacterium]|nr:hypothetical protein [Candidatus Nomurabacteria bacterium]